MTASIAFLLWFGGWAGISHHAGKQARRDGFRILARWWRGLALANLVMVGAVIIVTMAGVGQ